MRRGKAATALGIGIALVSFALPIIGVPYVVALLVFAAGSGFLIAAALWWYQGRHHRRVQAEFAPNIEAVTRDGEEILKQIDDPSVPQNIWEPSKERWISRAKEAVEERYLWWFSYFEGLPRPSDPTASPSAHRNAQRQVLENYVERLRDIALRQQVGRGEPVGRTLAKLVAVKELLMDAWYEAQRLLNTYAGQPEVENYRKRLHTLAGAALIESQARVLFSDDLFPPTAYSHPHMSDADFEFLAKRQTRLAELQTRLAQSDIRAEFDPDDWKDYW